MRGKKFKFFSLQVNLSLHFLLFFFSAKQKIHHYSCFLFYFLFFHPSIPLTPSCKVIGGMTTFPLNYQKTIKKTCTKSSLFLHIWWEKKKGNAHTTKQCPKRRVLLGAPNNIAGASNTNHEKTEIPLTDQVDP